MNVIRRKHGRPTNKENHGFLLVMLTSAFSMSACLAETAPIFDASVPDTSECVDHDGDGYGQGCPSGEDCDDGNSLLYADDCVRCGDDPSSTDCPCLGVGDAVACYEGPEGTESVGICRGGTRECIDGRWGPCNGQVLPEPAERCNLDDDDCDGEIDENVILLECDDCDLTCRDSGEVEPSAGDPGADGMIDSPGGGVEIGAEAREAGFAWIANDPEGTVSKIDLETGVEVARYRVGLCTVDASHIHPSRTAVDGFGDAYVANRTNSVSGIPVGDDMHGSVTKIASSLLDCFDRNDNGVIETSTGGTDVLPCGRDECVLWTVDTGFGSLPRALAIDAGDPDARGGYVWVGLYNHQRFLVLDPDDGSVVGDPIDVDPSIFPYGAAIDAFGRLWIADLGGGFQYVDTATREVGPLMRVGGGCESSYGIAVDRENRVWVGGVIESNRGCGYDPDTDTWVGVAFPGYGGRGVAIDGSGNVWMTDSDSLLYRFNADEAFAAGGEIDPQVIEIGSPGSVPIGVGIAYDGRIWAINQALSTAVRYDPATGAMDHFPTGLHPYTYSDFTGFQRRMFVSPRATWTEHFELCDDQGARWGDALWTVETSERTWVVIVVRTADSLDELDDATPVILATIPDDAAHAEASAGLGRRESRLARGGLPPVDVEPHRPTVEHTGHVRPLTHRDGPVDVVPAAADVQVAGAGFVVGEGVGFEELADHTRFGDRGFVGMHPRDERQRPAQVKARVVAAVDVIVHAVEPQGVTGAGGDPFGAVDPAVVLPACVMNDATLAFVAVPGGDRPRRVGCETGRCQRHGDQHPKQATHRRGHGGTSFSRRGSPFLRY